MMSNPVFQVRAPTRRATRRPPRSSWHVPKDGSSTEEGDDDERYFQVWRLGGDWVETGWKPRCTVHHSAFLVIICHSLPCHACHACHGQARKNRSMANSRSTMLPVNFQVRAPSLARCQALSYLVTPCVLVMPCLTLISSL